MLHFLNMRVDQVVASQAIKDNTGWTTTEVDTKGCSAVHFLIQLGATDKAMAALKIQESETSGSGYADITGADFSVSPATVPSATDDNKNFCVTVNMTANRKRYLELVATAGNGTAGTFLVCSVIKERLNDGPATAADRGFAQHLIV